MRTGGEHEAGRSQVVVLSAPLRSVTKYCYGHLAHGDVALLPQPLLLGLGRGARAEAEGPPARVLRGQRSQAAALSNTSLTLLPARLRHPSRSRSDSGQYHAWLLMLQRCYNVCPFFVNKSIWAKLSLLLSSRNQTIRCQVRRLQARSSFSFTKMKSCEKALTVAS